MSGIQISGPKCPDFEFSQLRQFQSTNNAQLCIFMLFYGQFLTIWGIRQIYLHDLGENKSVFILSAEMSGFSTKNVRDPRSHDPVF